MEISTLGPLLLHFLGRASFGASQAPVDGISVLIPALYLGAESLVLITSLPDHSNRTAKVRIILFAMAAFCIPLLLRGLQFGAKFAEFDPKSHPFFMQSIVILLVQSVIFP
jgi:hypothetical protein